MKVEGEKPSGHGREALSRGMFLNHVVSSSIANLTLPVFILFLPLLAVQLGASIFEIGLVGGASNAVYAFMPFLMGRFSDRGRARKFFIVASLTLLSVVSFLYFIVDSAPLLIVLRLFEGIGWATFWPSIEAALTHDSTRDPKKSLTVFNYSWSAAAAIGPLFGSLLVITLSIRLSFLATSVILIGTTLLNVIQIMMNNRRGRGSSEDRHTALLNLEQSVVAASKVSTQVEVEEQVASDQSTGEKISASFYFVSMALCAVSTGILLTFFSPFARSAGISILMIGVASFVFGLVRFLVYLLGVREGFQYFLFRRENRIRNVVVSVTILSLSSLVITLPGQSSGIYLISFAIVGACYSVVYSIAQAAMLAEASPEKMGAGAGLFESAIGVGAATGPILAGIMSGNALSNSFFVPTICLFPVLLIQFLILRKKRVRNAEL